MTAKLTIFARLEVQQFVGYVLWGVWRKTRSKQLWVDSVKTYGCTDTREQAWGVVATLVGDLPLKCLRRDIRTIMGEGRFLEGFQEGITAWRKYSPEQQAAFHEAGIRFSQVYLMHNMNEARLSSQRYAERQALAGRMLPHQCLKVLGLDSDVQDLAEIKKAYRSLVSLHHPDKGGASEHFVIIRKAYEQLTKSF